MDNAGRNRECNRDFATWKRLLSDAHPDRAAARGLPPEFIEVAEAKSAAINAAFTTVMRERRDLGLAVAG